MRGARPESLLEQSIERDGVIRRGDRVVVACSGGPDSVALAAALAAVAKPMELTLSLGYVHHGTRRSAWQDECIVLRLAATFQLPVDVARLDLAARDEATMRDARYGALTGMARARNANVIATAHHAQDQSETVLLALFRGAGSSGLAGMRARRALTVGIDVARPLLRMEPDDVAYYAQRNALPYAVDPTNANPTVRRNAVREALAALRPLFPGLDAAVARAAEVVGDEQAGEARADLRKQVREALQEQPGLRDVSFGHVEAAVRALEQGGSGRFHMKTGVSLDIERGAIHVIRDDT
jgi:tRNA(Ile)-lysidine synthase